MKIVTIQHWKEYVQNISDVTEAALSSHQIILDEHQPHTLGERFLMQAVTTTGGKKVILLGQKKNSDERFVIKIADDAAGKKEISDERDARSLLQSIEFNYESFHAPEEIAHFEYRGYLINVQRHIDQSSAFLERSTEEQFTYALAAFKAQERTRATTHRHFKKISRVFGARTWVEYKKFINYFDITFSDSPIDIGTACIKKAKHSLEAGSQRIEQYGGFLTHTDFVPHNFRINNGKMYLLDFSSLCFGNKHESWARFLNFMTLYNRELERLLIEYVENNRSVEERESLQLMRIYRLCEITSYYIQKVPQSDGALKELNTARVKFWHDVLAAELGNMRVSDEVVKNYISVRDSLRTEEEKKRQTGLH